MVTLRERHDPLRLMWRRLFLLLLFALTLSVALEVWNVWGKERESARMNNEAQAALTDLTQRQTRLEKDYGELQTDRGMEEALRDQYAMGKSGEGLIVIVEPPQPPLVQATSSVMQWLKDALSNL